MDITKGLSLAGALCVGRGAVVSFVGAAGKTTAMFRLAAELGAAGLRVVTSTTTHISQDQVKLSPASVTPDHIDLLAARLDRYGQCLVAGSPDGTGRVFGAPPDLVETLVARTDVDVVILEADGSRSLPFKAPAGHEPVVHPATTILAPIAGLQVLGQPLDEDHVHRPHLAAAIAGQPLGSPVTPATLARVLSHPEGGAKQRPPAARLVPILNRADTEADLEKGREAAALLMEYAAVDAVLLCRMRHDPPVSEAWARGRTQSGGDALNHENQDPGE